MRILILEDDLETLTKLFENLTRLENDISKQISITVYSEYRQVEEHLNTGTKERFDFILLDRDCKLGGSFHVLDLNKFSSSIIIGISSVPKYNQELREKGVKLIVDKDYKQLDKFAGEVIQTIKQNLINIA